MEDRNSRPLGQSAHYRSSLGYLAVAVTLLTMSIVSAKPLIAEVLPLPTQTRESKRSLPAGSSRSAPPKRKATTSSASCGNKKYYSGPLSGAERQARSKAILDAYDKTHPNSSQAQKLHDVNAEFELNHLGTDLVALPPAQLGPPIHLHASNITAANGGDAATGQASVYLAPGADYNVFDKLLICGSRGTALDVESKENSFSHTDVFGSCPSVVNPPKVPDKN